MYPGLSPTGFSRQRSGIEGNMMFCLNATAERRVLRDMFTQGRVLALVSILVAVGDWGVAQPPGDGPGRLPPPTGAFGVGRVTLLFEDSSRIEPLPQSFPPPPTTVCG